MKGCDILAIFMDDFDSNDVKFEDSEEPECLDKFESRNKANSNSRSIAEILDFIGEREAQKLKCTEIGGYLYNPETGEVLGDEDFSVSRSTSTVDSVESNNSSKEYANISDNSINGGTEEYNSVTDEIVDPLELEDNLEIDSVFNVVPEVSISLGEKADKCVCSIRNIKTGYIRCFECPKSNRDKCTKFRLITELSIFD